MKSLILGRCHLMQSINSRLDTNDENYKPRYYPFYQAKKAKLYRYLSKSVIIQTDKYI